MNIIIIDCYEVCISIINDLTSQLILAIDIEGILSPSSSSIPSIPPLSSSSSSSSSILNNYIDIWFIQIATRNNIVYLFDIQSYSNSILIIIKEILENKNIIKLFYDCRNDCYSIYLLYNCIVNNIIDLQLLYHIYNYNNKYKNKKNSNNKNKNNKNIQNDIKSSRLCSFGKALEDILSEEDYLKMKELKQLRSESTDDHQIWKSRPIPQAIIEYCCQDVQLLFLMKDSWLNSIQILSEVKCLSEQRAYYARLFPERHTKGKKDFKLNNRKNKNFKTCPLHIQNNLSSTSTFTIEYPSLPTNNLTCCLACFERRSRSYESYLESILEY